MWVKTVGKKGEKKWEKKGKERWEKGKIEKDRDRKYIGKEKAVEKYGGIRSRVNS